MLSLNKSLAVTSKVASGILGRSYSTQVKYIERLIRKYSSRFSLKHHVQRGPDLDAGYASREILCACVYAAHVHVHACILRLTAYFFLFRFLFLCSPSQGLLVKRSQGKSGALGRTNWKDRWFTVDGMYCNTQSRSVGGWKKWPQSVWRDGRQT